MPNAVNIISADDAMEFLNITDESKVAELEGFIASASQMWERRVGPVAGSPTYTESYDGGGSRIVLRHTPVQSVVSVTESFTTSLAYTLNLNTLDGLSGGDAYGYTFDAATGLLTRRMNGVATPFAYGIGNVRVVYVAGYPSVPADVKDAIKDLVKHKWETQRGGSRRPGGEPEMAMGASYAWPRRAEEVAATYIVPGIA